MMRGWNSRTIDWYLRAGEHSQYPGLILKEIKPKLRPHHNVLDIGCGPGLYALAIAPQVNRMLAMDKERTVLDTLDALARAQGLSNIYCIESDWPNIEVQEKVHVIISAFSSGQVMNRQASITKMLSFNPELLFLVAPGKYTHHFGWLEHSNNHADAEKTLGLLEQMGVGFSTKNMMIDFGQPVLDMDEATEFLAGFLGITNQDARKHAEKIAQPHSLGLYLPNRRNIVIINHQKP